MSKSILLVCFVFLSFVSAVFGSETGSTGWIIFRKLQFPEPESMSVTDGKLASVVYSPSVLSTIKRVQFLTVGEVGLAFDKTFGAILGYPFSDDKSSSAIAVGVFSYDVGTETLYWIDNGQLRQEDVDMEKDIVGLISYGKKWSDTISAGITLKFAMSKIVNFSATAYSVDTGVTYFASDKITTTLAIQNIGTSTEFVSKRADLPSLIWGCVQYRGTIKKVENGYFIIGTKIPYIFGDGSVLPSIEVEIGKLPIAVFVNYKLPIQEMDDSFSIGASLTMKKFDLCYSLSISNRLSSVQRISFNLKFGEDN